MKIKVFIRGFCSYLLERHSKRYEAKLNRHAEEYFAVEQAVADDDTAWEAEPDDHVRA